MAVTEITNESSSFITIIPDGSSDWDSQVNFPNGLRIWSVLFYPSAQNDVICLKDSSDSGPTILKAKDVDGRGILLRLPGNNVFPYLDFSECTFDTPANVRITFHTA
jgi:hypothetical protein